MRHPIALRLLTITLVVLGPMGRSKAATSLNSAPAVSNPEGRRLPKKPLIVSA